MGSVKKLVTGFAEIFVCEISIYLFGSYLRFKRLYRFLSTKPILFASKSSKCLLKFKIKVFNIVIRIAIFYKRRDIMKIKTFATFTHRQLDKQVNRFLKNDIHVLEIQTRSNWLYISAIVFYEDK